MFNILLDILCVDKIIAQFNTALRMYTLTQTSGFFFLPSTVMLYVLLRQIDPKGLVIRLYLDYISIGCVLFVEHLLLTNTYYMYNNNVQIIRQIHTIK